MSKNEVLQTIEKTPPMQIASLDFVKEKFVDNYNKCNNSDAGELMYHRQLVHFNQTISNDPNLTKADKFSLYACFVTAAVNGYSLDPQDDEVYLLAIKGKAHLWPQAGAKVRRLIRTRQIKSADQPKLVYEGDTFQVEGGRVVKHVENFASENIIAGYIRFIISEKEDKYFIYRKSDWEAWRKKSSNGKTYKKSGQHGEYLVESLWDNGVINGQNPEPNFLRTKIVKHAAKEKCWATGSTPPDADKFHNVEIDAEEEEIQQLQEAAEKRSLNDHYADFEEVRPEASPAGTSPEPQQNQKQEFPDDNF